MDRNENKYLKLIFKYLENKCGFSFSSDEITRKCHILEKRLYQSEVASLFSYYNLLNGNSFKANDELQNLVNEITNNNTSFFRYRPSFDLLEKVVLPDLFTSRFAHNDDVIRIWSAGCASGEEAYSIAISCLEFMPDSNPVRIEIIATDISTENLDKAKQGCFSKSKISSLSENIKKKYFSEFLKEDGILSYIADKRLKKLISFRYLNLADNKISFPDNIDIIFCRNVFTYLKENVVKDILKRFNESLVPGGYLFTSAIDNSISGNKLFDLVSYGDSTCFKKRRKLVLNKNNTSIRIENRSLKHPILNKTRSDRKKYKIDRVKSFISKLDSAYNRSDVAGMTSSCADTTYFGFKLNDNLFCFDINNVKEVIHAGHITSVPSSPSYVIGIMNYRGKVLTLVDISEFLKLKEKVTYTNNHIHIVVLNSFGSLIGIIISSFFTTFETKDRCLNTSYESVDSYIEGVFDIDNEKYKLLKIYDLVSLEILD